MMDRGAQVQKEGRKEGRGLHIQETVHSTTRNCTQYYKKLYTVLQETVHSILLLGCFYLLDMLYSS